MIIEINESNYLNFIEKNKYCLVLFKTSWCRICGSLLPVLEMLEEELNFEISVFTIDVSESDDLIKKFRINTIPSLIFFNNGIELDRTQGYKNLEELTKWLKRYMI